MLVFNLSTLIFLLILSKGSCSHEVTLSCGIDNEIEMTGVKGEPGVGLKGSKGEEGDSDECEEKFMRLEERIRLLERELNETQQIGTQPFEPIVPPRENVSPRPSLITARRDCNDVAEEGFTRSGVYDVVIRGRIVPVYCDMDTDGGSWLVIQRRFDGSENFFRGWENYTRGFGELQSEFWLGLENIHLLTRSGSYQLRVDLEDWENDSAYALYSRFLVRNAATNYTLRLGAYSGTASDSMRYNNNHPFTTRDRDNDIWSPGNCAVDRKGAWWYVGCTYSNLNGMYRYGGQLDITGVEWLFWKNNLLSLKRTEMKIRRN